MFLDLFVVFSIDFCSDFNPFWENIIWMGQHKLGPSALVLNFQWRTSISYWFIREDSYAIKSEQKKISDPNHDHQSKEPPMKLLVMWLGSIISTYHITISVLNHIKVRIAFYKHLNDISRSSIVSCGIIRKLTSKCIQGIPYPRIGPTNRWG